MVVSEFDASDPSWQGMAPLFMGYLHPRYNENDWSDPNWVDLVTSRVGLEFKVDHGPWQSFPWITLGPDKTLPKSA